MITQALVANGAKVYITGRREEKLESTVEQYNTGPGSLHALQGDVSSKQECIRLAKEMGQKEANGIQLLVNNAGIARDSNTIFCMYATLFGECLSSDGKQQKTASRMLPMPLPYLTISYAQKKSSGLIRSTRM